MTYYIATTGNDTTGNGSSSTPWLTLAKFLSSSSNGDTCMVNDGTYTWASASIGSRTITAVNYGQVIFDAAAAYAKWVWTSGTVEINGIVFYNNVASTANVYKPIFSSGYTAVTVNFTDCVFHDIYITGTTGWGHLFANNAENAVGSAYITYTLTGCQGYKLYKNTSAGAGCLVGSENAMTINMYHCAWYLDGTGSNKLTSVFSDNGAITGIVKNTIFDSTSSLGWGTSDTTINNTTTYSVGYNITSFPSATGDLTSDPLLVDPNNNIFRTRPDSPCRGAGVTI